MIKDFISKFVEKHVPDIQPRLHCLRIVKDIEGAILHLHPDVPRFLMAKVSELDNIFFITRRFLIRIARWYFCYFIQSAGYF